MQKRIFLAFTLFFIAALFCNAQKKIIYDNQQWLQYYNQLGLSRKLTLYTDVSFRRVDYFTDWSQITFRTGLGYAIAQNLQGITGLAYFTFFTQNKLSRIEYRPYQEVSTTQSLGKITVQHRLRVEARYFRTVADNRSTSISNFNFRFRYRLYCSIPILKLSETKADRKLLVNVGDELFINAGEEITYNMFDNNRLLVGLTFQQNNNLNFTLAYISQFGQRNNPATYENSDILTLGITHKISLRKAQTTKAQ